MSLPFIDRFCLSRIVTKLKYREIEKKMRGLGQSTAMRIELDLTHMFTFGLQGASYTNMDGETVNTVTGDGLAIFS